tara:strand:- start:1642 stop:1947 length:306 start_codon:yes stop_codon:yes gene_type:complete
MKKLTGTILALVLTTATGHALAAGDIGAGKNKAMACAGCHGANGISNNDMWPNLAGQKAGYTAKQLRDFREGNRTDPVMSGMAKPLSDQDILDLAAYFASL